MARAGSIKFQVSNIIKEHNGIRISKLEARNTSGLKAENNHKVSNYFHSYKSLDNARRDLINLGEFAKKEFGIKDMKQISKEVINSWIKSKDISYNTASNYLSEINKVSEHLGIIQQEIREMRSELKIELSNPQLQTRAYTDLNKIQLNNKNNQISFELQRDYGLRLKEATHINLNRQLKGENVLEIQGKGGKTIEIKIKDELLSKIKEYSNEKGIFETSKKSYVNELKKEIKAIGQTYNGTHGIRHTFAQTKLEEGYSKKEVSEMMGHNREEITNTYLR
jgi:site-specific recombinase XerD